MATLQQERHVEYVNGAQERFVVTSRMVSATIPLQLPHLLVFVLNVVDRVDPKDDTLLRVARVSDLTSLPQGRDAALLVPGTGQAYLSDICVLAYGTLVEALAGAQAIQDRVNALINDWMIFNADFSAPSPTPATIVLPTTDPSQKQALIDAYAAAKQAAYQQLQTTQAAADALTAAQADYTYKQQLVTDLGPIATKMGIVQSDMSSAATGHATLKTAGDNFIAVAGCAAAPDLNTFQNALNVGANQSTLNTAYVADTGALSSLINTYVTQRTAERDTAATVVSAAQTNKNVQDAALASAQAAETSALSALLAVAPDFDATSVPYVPG